MRSVARAVAKMVLVIGNTFVLPMIRWSARHALPEQIEAIKQKQKSDAPYIEPHASINHLLVLAAFEDYKEQKSADPNHCQSMLNACLEEMRKEPLSSIAVGMFGSLVAAGYPPDEAIYRVMANVFTLGMFTERRLKKEA